MTESFDGRRRRYVPMDVHIAFTPFGDKLLKKWGMEGLCTWMLLLAACKREQVQGTFTYTTEFEGWGKLGASATGFSLDEFMRYCGQQKQTKRTRQGRIHYVSIRGWKRWNNPRPTPDTSQQNPSTEQENTQQEPPEYNTIVAPEVEGEVEGECDTEAVNARPTDFIIPTLLKTVPREAA